MPGMIQLEGSPVSHSTTVSQSSLSSPLQSFSSLTLSPLSTAGISPQSLLQQPPASLSLNPWLQELKSEERGLLLIQLLLKCAGAAASGNIDFTNLCLEQLSLLASLTGDPMQRVATYFMEGLAARITQSWPGVYKALNCTHLPTIADLLSARQIFFNLCPYLKFAFTIVNQCILDAMEGEKVVHIIDLGASEAIQWVALLQMLSTRVGGPPHLRMTIINERKEVLDQLGQRLSEEAEALDIPFQFHPVVTKLDQLDVEMLRVKTGEAVAVSSVLQLHYLLSDDPRNFSTGSAHPPIYRGSPHLGEGGQSSGERNTNSRSSNLYPQSGLGEGAYFSEGLDDRVVKRTREGTLINLASPLQQEMCRFNNGVAVDATNNERTLRELFENEAKESVFLNGRAFQYGNLMEQSVSTSPSKMNATRGENFCTTADRILCILRSLAPKIMVVMEQEGNHNSPNLMERFVAALHYYSAMFDSLESTLPQKFFMERVTLEKFLFGREIHNIVACEGVERVERHEKIENWRQRAEWAGFSHVPFALSTMMQARRLLTYTCESYRLVEDRGCLTLCWQETPLFSASAWQA